MADLTTTAAVKAYIDHGSTGSDTQIGTIVSAVSESMQRWMGRQIPSAAYTDEKHSGDGIHDFVIPAESPVTAVASVVLNGSALASGDWDIENAAGRWTVLYYTPGGATYPSAWPRGRRNVVLTYTAGYATVPKDLEQAAIEQCAYVFGQRKRLGQRTKSAGGDLTESYLLTDFLPTVLPVMESYRSVHVA